MDAKRLATLARVVRTEGPLCAVCGWRRATDLHEIISRRRVQGNALALQEVYSSVELCAAVCRTCHPIGNDAVNKALLASKIQRYGRPRVEAAFARVNQHMTEKVLLSEYE